VNVHLIDGTYELFRAFFGAPSAQSPAGVEVGATRGLLSSLWSLLREPGVSHAACAFDHVIESFRNELFDGYKTSAGIPEELLAQFPLAERATFALGIVTWPMIEFEADDAIATAAARFAKDPSVERVFLCSPDKDFAQCVSGERVVLFDRLRKKVIGEAGVKEKFGVPPSAIPDFLALVGDTADGIPGLAGWGSKSAATVLSHFGSLEHIPSKAAEWGVNVRGAQRLSESLNQARELSTLYKRLATLRRDVPLSESLEDLKWQGARRTELGALCEEIDFTSFIDRVPQFRD
jgi:5'-3' exonuclease